MPRFMRAVLLLSTLSLLVIPTGNADAQLDDEIVGTVVAGNAASCTTHPHLPPNDVARNISHERCHTGAGQGFLAADVDLDARRRPADGPVRHVVCGGAVDSIGFRTRENLAEGRGFISPTHVVLDGRLTHPGSGLPHEDVVCRVRLEGTFHRVGTAAIGRLRIDVHAVRVADPGDDVFRHHYCARFEATAVPQQPPVGSGTLVTAVVEGRIDCPNEDVDNIVHGRLPSDDTTHG